MLKKAFIMLMVGTFALVQSGCQPAKEKKQTAKADKTMTPIKMKLAKYATVKLTADISWLTKKEKEIISLLFDAAKIMDEIYWEQSFGDKEALMGYFNCVGDEDIRKFSLINYGPWDRLDNNAPFIDIWGMKPKGANFYPKNMTVQEFEQWGDTAKTSLYTLIRRDEQGRLISVPYNVAYKEKHEKAAELLKKAATLADDPGLKNYLELRAEALVTNNYRPSDFAWMDMKTSNIDFVVGPIENYEDGLFGYKAAHEAFILVKDLDWSKKLGKYTVLVPQLQKELPVDEKYKKEVPGTGSDIFVYDAIYYAGDCNSGSKSIAINLPNDEKVQLEKGSRKLQLKNAMRAKFDNILMPIANVLITPEQRKHVTFNAFFTNVLFHEVSHGMGIKNTITGKGPVRKVLQAYYSPMEEAKADILGLYLVTKLYEMGEITEGDVMDNYVTFMAGIFRSSRFGAASAHGKANMMRFNFFEKTSAFTRNAEGVYSVNFEKMKEAVVMSVQDIIKIQGDGDIEAAKKLIEETGIIKPQLLADLNRLKEANIPVDIVFEQGKDVVGLK